MEGKKETPILIVDDDQALLFSMKSVIVSAGLPEPILISDSRQVMDMMDKQPCQIAMLDLLMPHIGGMELLQKMKEENPETECVIITAVDEVATAVEAMRFGAFDYLVKPLQADKLLITIKNAMEKYHLRQRLNLAEREIRPADLRDPDAFKDMVAVDEAMMQVFHQADTYASTDYNLIITGETGTGKEMLARIIHRLNHPSECPFVAVNMASFNRTLFEDEFFGHSKGAFTGAQGERKGFFEAAQGGTIFLDEITELDKDLQGKLLRVIEEKEIYRLGSTTARNVDARIICSTNRDILDEVRKGDFRKDLFHRLNVCLIHIPPLRERRKDILPLANHFLRLHVEKLHKKISSLSHDLEEALIQYPYPGNVREMENIIAAAVLNENKRTLTLASAPSLRSTSVLMKSSPEEFLPLAEMEKRHIHRVLQAVGGNRTQAAIILGIGLRTLQRKIRGNQ